MPRGGRRTGQQGRAYPNRSDLNAQPVRTVPNQTYGQAGQQAASQQVIPLPQQQPFQSRLGNAAPSPPPLDAPTQRPQEPLTAGANFGPGPGPEALGPMAQAPDVESFLRGVYSNFPDPSVLDLLQEARRSSPSAAQLAYMGTSGGPFANIAGISTPLAQADATFNPRSGLVEQNRNRIDAQGRNVAGMSQAERRLLPPPRPPVQA